MNEALLRQLEWEQLPADFAPRRRMTAADWRAWDGYEPQTGRINGSRRCSASPPAWMFQRLPPVLAAVRDEQTRVMT